MQIFPNGTLSYALPTQAAQELDASGWPIEASSSTLRSVPCTISTLSEDRKGRYDDGRFRNCQYSVTCNMEDVGTEFCGVKYVTLTHEIKGSLGSFTVQRIEFYTITMTVEIWI